MVAQRQTDRCAGRRWDGPLLGWSDVRLSRPNQRSRPQLDLELRLPPSLQLERKTLSHDRSDRAEDRGYRDPGDRCVFGPMVRFGKPYCGIVQKSTAVS